MDVADYSKRQLKL